MSREIKFRGKRLGDEEWIYGDLSQWSNGRVDISIPTDNPNEKEGVKVIACTVGQFTGLCDKNGKEIYEDDVFTVNGKYPKLIKYRQDHAGFCMANLYDLDKEYLYPWCPIHPDWWKGFNQEIEVIGNIIDNHELLNYLN